MPAATRCGKPVIPEFDSGLADLDRSVGSSSASARECLGSPASRSPTRLATIGQILRLYFHGYLSLPNSIPLKIFRKGVAYLCTGLYCYTLDESAPTAEDTMKSERHNAIRTLLSEGPVLSQDEMRRKLARRGFDVTQATLSRDIHDLRLYKGPNGYAVPNGATNEADRPSLNDVFSNFGLAVRQAMNQLVLRTTAGSAQPVAAALDHEYIPEVLGTIAGDDTVLIICQDQKHASSLRLRLETLLEA